MVLLLPTSLKSSRSPAPPYQSVASRNGLPGSLLLPLVRHLPYAGLPGALLLPAGIKAQLTSLPVSLLCLVPPT